MADRLPTHIKPIQYHLKIIPEGPSYDKFYARCIIGIEILNNDFKYIILNGSNLDISKVKLIGPNGKHLNTSITHDSSIDQIRFDFESMPEKVAVLVIKYTGIISTELNGFYKSEQDGHIIMSTQFEPIYARKCFPCFDEPAFKATFKLEIVAPADRLVLSNTNIEEIIVFDSRNNLYKFESTPIMSTYLVAFYIGEADYVEASTTDNVQIRVWTHTDKSYSELALDTAVKCMNFMVDYFDVAYPLDKLDLICVPEFSAGAMENWGLIIFREKYLVADPTVCTDDQLEIIYTICHEIAHQWFGNLVTMEWWSCLWLNESFATWMGWLVVEHIRPDYKLIEQVFRRNFVSALDDDAVQNSHPIEVNIVKQSSIDEIFDAISYDKGSAIITMLANYVGPDDFKNSIRLYIKTHSYGNTTTTDLWDSLEKISGKNISGMMHNWINKQNYPLVVIKSHGPNHLKIKQKVFTFGNTDTDTIWSIPLTDDIILDQKKIIIPKSLIQTKINSNATGFYRIHYDTSILDHLIQNRSRDLSELDIISILSDMYYILKAGRINFSYYLEYLDKILLISKDAKMLWQMIRTNYNDFKLVVGNGK